MIESKIVVDKVRIKEKINHKIRVTPRDNQIEVAIPNNATVIVNVDHVRGMDASPPQVGVWWGKHSFLSLIREERGEKTCGSPWRGR